MGKIHMAVTPLTQHIEKGDFVAVDFLRYIVEHIEVNNIKLY